MWRETIMEITHRMDQEEALGHFEEYHIDVDGVDVAVYRRGTGTPMILVHGWVGAASHWSIVGYLLSSSYAIYLVDLPGHGRSGDMGERLPSLSLYTEVVYTILSELGRPAWVVGHSMGGAIAQNFANLYPDMVTGLVLVSTGFHFTSFLPKRVAKMMITQAMKMKSFMNDLGEFITKYIYRVKEGYKRRRLRGAIELIQSYDVRTALDPFLHVIMEWDISKNDQFIDRPILIVCGGDDMLTPLQRSIEMNKTYTNSFLKIFPNEYHMIIITSAEDVADIIRTFTKHFEDTV